MEDIHRCVRRELRRRDIKLWEPPYFFPDDQNDNDNDNTTTSAAANSAAKKGPNQAVLKNLSSVWSKHLSLKNDGDGSGSKKISQEEIYKSLVHFQTRALEKLKAEKKKQKIGGTSTDSAAVNIGATFTIKILGLHQYNDSLATTSDEETIKGGGNKITSISSKRMESLSCPKTWAEHVGIKCEPLHATTGLSSESPSKPPIKANETTAPTTSTAPYDTIPMVVTLTLQNISRTLTLSTFLTELKHEVLNIKNDNHGDDDDTNAEHCIIRMVYQGTNLLQSLSDKKNDALYEVVASHSKKISPFDYAQRGPSLLCLISPPPPSPSSRSASGKSTTKQEKRITDQQLIDSIKHAASRITKTTNFDITDQNGKIVPMTKSDRLAFLMTLGLHKLGQKRLYHRYDDAGGDDDTHGNDGSGGGTDAAASALTFLLQADAEWNKNPSMSSLSSSSPSQQTMTPSFPTSSTSLSWEDWKTKADNYGLLQLDIAWSYLKLQSMEHLPDAIQRLDIAEGVLRKQVHSNFVTLALVQAELEHGVVPPLAAVFVKLFLLQGVGYLYYGSSGGGDGGRDERAAKLLREKGEERLNQAYLLCQRLRNASKPESVLQLQEVVRDNLTKHEAISALRKCNGDANAAVELLEKDRKDEKMEHQKRRIQKRIGLCENGMDYVNLDLVGQLACILGLDCGGGGEGGQRRVGDYQHASYGGFSSTVMVPGLIKNEKIIESLLRLSNNDVGRAVDLYQELQMDGDKILLRASNLEDDNGGGARNASSNRKKSRDDAAGGKATNEAEGMDMEIDDMALATLESYGVEESMARMALRKTKNDVEKSLFWLTEQHEKEEKEDAASTSCSSSSSSLSSMGKCSKRGFESGESKTPLKSLKKDGSGDVKEGKSVGNDGTSSEATGKPTVDEMLQKKKEEDKKEKQRKLEEEAEQLRREMKEEEERLRREREEEDAFQLLQDILMNHGGGGHDNMQMEYYIGSDLDEEWSLIQRYRRSL